ncbi:hypothetical protein FK220_000130 [Flavobacteriaceae bacterium TP-CH-4]|uniref:Uncharacterized protein n=1 Tax=Pelagihabitans pacificus TaxID=2696054 RepID=A0A967ANT1_9FLAO|nr:hypothetical protein [Pelagihabitans pacificus]NHF57726.1 hypothetical protein [Pelagihabitans pacificus]
MKNIGIWMDQEKAHIVELMEEREKMQTLFSEMEFFNPKGGSGTRFKGGPQDVVQDSRYLEREKHQLAAYFEKIVNEIKDAENIALFGPAETAEKFRKELNDKYQSLGAKVRTVTKADSMTDNQIKALVRDFFGR